MTPREFVVLQQGVLSLPADVAQAMGDPQRLLVSEDKGGSIWIQKFARKPLWKRRVGRFLRTLRGAPRSPPFAVADRLEKRPEDSTFRLPGDVSTAERKYRVVNYDPVLYLIPADESPESQSRERAWASLNNYHEHRHAQRQERNANRVSQWFARDVIAPLKPAHVLELGCGGGRNLLWIHRTLPQTVLHGIDINPQGVATAKSQLGDAGSNVRVGSLYELERFPSGSIDVVYTVGVLEHIPHERVRSVLREMSRIAGKAVVHFEVHGTSHRFDYHRYPRDYAALYRELGLGEPSSYEVYPRSDFRSRRASSFNYALLTLRKPQRPQARAPSPLMQQPTANARGRG